MFARGAPRQGRLSATRRRTLRARGERRPYLPERARARRSGAQRLERGLRLRAPLRKDHDRLSRAQGGCRRREQGRIAGGIGIIPRLLAAVNRQPADQAQERTDQRMAKERRVREHAQRPRDHGEQDHRVHDRVVMIGGDDQGPRRGNVLGAGDLDVRVEELQQPAREGAHEAVPHAAFPRGRHCGSRARRVDASAVSRCRCRAPISHRMPAATNIALTSMNARSML